METTLDQVFAQLSRENALRLEHEASTLIADGYRIGELHIIVQQRDLLGGYTEDRINWRTGLISPAPWGEVMIRVEVQAWRLFLRRAWRQFFPYYSQRGGNANL